MSFKKLFIGGLCVSAVFAACTKEISVEPSFEGNNAAISLGEGVTITGSKLGVDTRAEFNNDFSAALWNDGDKLGAAWFDMVTSIDEKTGEVKHSSFDSFMSNTWFEKVTEGTVATADFQTTANLMAGAYVLYFPYNPDWTDVKSSIPVSIDAEQTMDITPGNELAHINENIFAYTTYKAVPGGAQLGKFSLNQLTNALAVRVAVSKPELMLLEKPVTIKKVIIESNVFYSKGAITKPSSIDYEKNLPAATYTPAEKASRIILDVTGEADGYKIEKLTVPGVVDNRTKPFYISVLPWDKITNVNELPVKVLVTKEGEDMELVYVGHITEDNMKEFNNAANKQGKVGNLTVYLDAELKDTGDIYTEDQFKAKWAEANKAGQTKKPVLNVKTDINLPDFDLDPVVADITIASEGEVVVGNVNITTGSLTVNDLTVKGDLNVDGGLNVAGALAVEGDFEIGPDAKIATTNGTIAIDGKTRVVGKADASALNIVKIGEIEVTTTGNFSVDGSKLEEGQGELSKVTNRGELTLASVDLTGTLDNTGTVTIADENVVNYGTINNNGTITGTSADQALTNYGVVNQNKEVMAKPFLYIDNLVDEEEGYKGSINVKKDYWIGGVNDGEITVTPGAMLKLGAAYTGKGVINALGNSTANVTVDAGTAAEFTGTIVANMYTIITDNASVFETAKPVTFVVNKNSDLDEQDLTMISTLRVSAKDYKYTNKHNSIVLELDGAKVTVPTNYGKINRYAKTIVKSNSEITTAVAFNFSGSDSSVQYGIVEENAVLTLNGTKFEGTIKVKNASNVVFGKDVDHSITTLVLY